MRTRATDQDVGDGHLSPVHVAVVEDEQAYVVVLAVAASRFGSGDLVSVVVVVILPVKPQPIVAVAAVVLDDFEPVDSVVH